MALEVDRCHPGGRPPCRQMLPGFAADDGCWWS